MRVCFALCVFSFIRSFGRVDVFSMSSFYLVFFIFFPTVAGSATDFLFVIVVVVAAVVIAVVTFTLTFVNHAHNHLTKTFTKVSPVHSFGFAYTTQ